MELEEEVSVGLGLVLGLVYLCEGVVEVLCAVLPGACEALCA